MHSSGASGARVAAPLWRIAMLPSRPLRCCGRFWVWATSRVPGALAFLPVHRTRAAPPTQPVPPRLLRRATDVLPQRDGASHPVVPNVSVELHAPHPILVWSRRLAVGAPPWPQRLRGPPEPFPGWAACDHPQPPTCACPVRGAAENRAWAVPLCRCLPGLRLPEDDQRRLRWMPTPAKAGTPLWSYAPALLSVGCPRTADDTGIGTTAQDAAALHPGRDLALAPCLPHMMEEYRGKDGCDASPLHDPGLRVGARAVVPDSGTPPLPHETP